MDATFERYQYFERWSYRLLLRIKVVIVTIEKYYKNMLRNEIEARQYLDNKVFKLIL